MGILLNIRFKGKRVCLIRNYWIWWESGNEWKWRKVFFFVRIFRLEENIKIRFGSLILSKF